MAYRSYDLRTFTKKENIPAVWYPHPEREQCQWYTKKRNYIFIIICGYIFFRSRSCQQMFRVYIFSVLSRVLFWLSSSPSSLLLFIFPYVYCSYLHFVFFSVIAVGSVQRALICCYTIFSFSLFFDRLVAFFSGCYSNVYICELLHFFFSSSNRLYSHICK